MAGSPTIVSTVSPRQMDGSFGLRAGGGRSRSKVITMGDKYACSFGVDQKVRMCPERQLGSAVTSAPTCRNGVEVFTSSAGIALSASQRGASGHSIHRH